MPSVTLVPTPGPYTIGQIIEIQVLTSSDFPETLGIEGEVVYDADILSLTDVTYPPELNVSFVPSEPVNASGETTVGPILAGVPPNGPAPSGEFVAATLSFEVKTLDPITIDLLPFSTSLFKDLNNNEIVLDSPVTLALDLNADPVAVNDSDSVQEEGSVNIDVLFNDSDPNADTLTIDSFTDGTNGTVTETAAGILTYTPNADFFGTDSFSYTITDGNGGSDTATVEVTVTNVNDAPVAAPLSVSGDEDTVISGALTATDVDGDTLTFALDTGPSNGSVVINPDGTFEYTPNGDYNGSDSFNYTVDDNNGGTATETVSITVNAVNDAPVAAPLSVSGDEDTAISGMLTATDVDSGTLTFALDTGPSNGSVTVNPDGTFEYTPATDYNGPDSFTFTVDDGDGGIVTEAVSITVNAVNNAPVAAPLSVSGDEDTVISGALTATDVDGDTLTFALDTGPSNGSIVINPDGTFEYTPNGDYNGSDSFNYTVDDNNGGTATETVSITVNAVNDAPVAAPLSVSGDEDTAISGMLTATDVDSGTLTFALDTGPSNGSVTVNPDGTFEYTPATDYNGPDSFIFTVDDGDGGIVTEAVSTTVNAVNDAPVAAPLSVSGDEDTVISGALTATDVDGDTLTFALDTGPSNGSVVINPDGTFEYTPNGDYNGSDSFNYTVDDNNGGTATETVSITVNAVNDAPVAAPLSVSGDEDTAISGMLTATDVDSGTLTFALDTGPSNGSVTVNPDGTFEYTPATDYNGPDSFIFTVDDGDGGIVTEAVSTTVNAVNDAPVAAPLSVSGDEDTVISGALTATDVDGDTLTFALDTGPSNGSVVINPDGTFEYTPNGDYNGSDSFNYTVDDNNGGTATETVSITVNAVNDAPVAAPLSVSGDEDTAISGMLTATDVDSGTLTFALDTGPSNGSVTVNPDGTFEYTPATDYNGPDSFTFTVDDGDGGIVTEAVSITVNAVNNAPVAAPLSVSGDEDTVISGALTATDVDGDTLTFALDTGPSNGSIVINPDGTFEYTPNGDYNGSDSFNYTVDDNNGGTATETVSITVNAVNDAPVAAPLSVSGDEDTAISGMLTATDVDSGTLTFALDTGPSNGSVTVNPDGTFEYTPATDYNGPDSFTFTVDDGDGGIVTEAVSITVNAVNDAPVAAPLSVSGDEETVISGALTATDVDGDTLTFALDTGPSNGSVVINPDGTFEYTPNGDYNGSDSFNYTVDDNNGGTAAETVSITVNAVNDAPVAAPLSVSGDEDTAISGMLTATDVDSGTLTFALDTGPSNGSVTVNPDGTFEYTPATDYNGPDSFIFTVDDGDGGIVTEAVSTTVNAVNDAPVAAPLSVSGDEDTVISGALTATDVDGDTLTFALDTGPSNGSVVINPDGTFEYTPNGDYNGSDSFNYTVDDNNGGTATETVSITVNAVNDAPVAAPLSVSGDEDTAISGMLTATDVDSGTLTFALDTGPSNGSVTVNPDGTFEYTPATDYNGPDSFTFTVDDGDGGIVTEAVSITVNAVNNAPVAAPLSVSGDEDTVISGALTATDVDGDTLTFALDTGPSNGSIVINPDGTFEYTPNGDYNGSDSFNYTVDDNNGGTATETVSITVNAVNDAPVAAPLSVSGDEDTAISGMLTATDVDSGTLTFALDTGPSNGSVTVNPDGTFEYTPATDYNGPDSFTFTVDDGDGGIVTEAVSITVNAVNDAPVAAPLSVSGDEETVISGALTATDVDGDTLTFALDTGPSNGSVVINPDGTFEYTPNGDYNGSDSFNYTVDDNNGGTAAETVSITVNAANDAPELTFGDEFDFLDSASGPVFIATATDVDGDMLTFSLGGTDAGFFDIDPTSGAVTLSATTPPEFTIADEDIGSIADVTQSFDLTVSVTDDTDTVDQDVTVNFLKDTDGDGFADDRDNALFVANADQRDTDGDGYGNIIDADLDNNGFVGLDDLSLFTQAFGSEGLIDGTNVEANADFNGDGAVALSDLFIFRELFGQDIEMQSLIGDEYTNIA